MKILVTGGSGFLGSHVAEKLSAEGHEVRALVRKSSNRSFLKTLPKLEFAEGSVEERDAVRDAVKGVDAIVHSAGLVKAKTAYDFYLTNVQGTRNLLEAASDLAPQLKRFVQVSSLEASGPSKDGTPVSLSQENPVTSYGKSKLEADKTCLLFKDKLPVTILRPGAIYGPRDVEILEAFKAAKKKQYPVIGEGLVKGCYIYGPDCADACIKAILAEVPSGSIYFVDDGEARTMKEAMGELLPKALGVTPLLRFGVPLGLLKVASIGVEAYGKLANKAVMLTPEKANMLGHHWVCDSSRTRKDLNWTPQMPLFEGFRKTAAWYTENNWM